MLLVGGAQGDDNSLQYTPLALVLVVTIQHILYRHLIITSVPVFEYACVPTACAVVLFVIDSADGASDLSLVQLLTDSAALLTECPRSLTGNHVQSKTLLSGVVTCVCSNTFMRVCTKGVH